jgi:2-polyprenyl-6-methoxyphenol hydroxylase-like FAD-dependent oxidoreductase
VTERSKPDLLGGSHALVIGAGIAGLLSAAALASRFSRVTVIDRDVLPDRPGHRKFCPQGHHNHLLSAAGLAAIEALLPGVDDDLAEAGAPLSDWGGAFQHFDHHGVELPRIRSGISIRNGSRGLFEFSIRRRLGERANVEILTGREVVGLCFDPAGRRVTGAMVRLDGAAEATAVGADAVVCAPGRRLNPLKRWLHDAGFEWPRESRIQPRVRYTTQFFRLRDGARPDWNMSLYVRANSAVVCNFLEGGTFLIGLADFGDGVVTPADRESFLACLRSMAVPVYAKMAERHEPIGEVQRWRVTEDRLAHFEEIERWPESLLVLGDSACTINPIYGQGMSVCALSALRLRDQLAAGEVFGPATADFQRSLAGVYRDPWWLSTNFDLSYPATLGPPPSWADRLALWYFKRVQIAGRADESLWSASAGVKQMTKPLASLLDPKVLVPALRHWLEQFEAAKTDEERALLMPT